MVVSACFDSRTGTQIRNSEASRSVRSSGPKILGMVLSWTALDGEHQRANDQRKDKLPCTFAMVDTRISFIRFIIKPC